MVLKGELTFFLTYLRKISLDLIKKLRRTIERDFACCRLKIIFRSKCRSKTLFQVKDSLEKKN